MTDLSLPASAEAMALRQSVAASLVTVRAALRDLRDGATHGATHSTAGATHSATHAAVHSTALHSLRAAADTASDASKRLIRLAQSSAAHGTTPLTPEALGGAAHSVVPSTAPPATLTTLEVIRPLIAALRASARGDICPRCGKPRSGAIA